MRLFRKAKSALDQINDKRPRVTWEQIILTTIVALGVGALLVAVYWVMFL